jgi:hypothetical protein
MYASLYARIAPPVMTDKVDVILFNNWDTARIRGLELGMSGKGESRREIDGITECHTMEACIFVSYRNCHEEI